MWSYIRLLKAKCVCVCASFVFLFLIFITVTSASTEEFSLKRANFSPGYAEYKCVTYVSIENGTISRAHARTPRLCPRPENMPPSPPVHRHDPFRFLRHFFFFCKPVPEGADGP